MNIILFGPPGVGKGTQGVKLAKKFGIVHLAMGDLLRAAVAQETALGLKAKAFMDAGKLVTDDLVIGLIEETMQKVVARFEPLLKSYVGIVKERIERMCKFETMIKFFTDKKSRATSFAETKGLYKV